ncbi:MAG: STAS domain-containing protein [Candidatus Omnitrophica bacterium]|nr:STAS domain-containing protein [Candidatus Omnitrophota bacterium]
MFKPKLLTCLKDYSFTQFRSDLIAGLIVGVVALPLAIAFAIASGVSPDRGLVTAVVAGFLISALGGSRVQIGGPTGAFVVIVYAIVQRYGIDGLVLATLMGGVILIIMGLVGFGVALKFIPYPVTVGFTSGIAVIIALAQVKDFLGLSMDQVPAEFVDKIVAYSQHITSFNHYAVVLSFTTVIIIFLWQRLSKVVPGSLVALLTVTAVAYFLKLPVETVGSRFGDIPHALSWPVFPAINLDMVQTLLPSAFTIAILAGIESLLSAVVADGMIGGKHRSNTELVAQGIANIASALFGGMPATGAIARTATNVHNGGRTPVAGIVHALTLVLIMYLFAKWVVYIPLACLSGILVLVAYRMSEWKSFVMILRSPRSDVVVLLITFLLTVIMDLTVAIEVGVVLSAFLLIHRLSLTPNIGIISRDFKANEDNGDDLELHQEEIPNGVEVYEIIGAFFFGVASTFIETMNNIEKQPKVRILRMRNVLSVDATALNALRHVVRNAKKHNLAVVLSGIHAQPMMALRQSGLYEEIGEENVLPNIDAALERAREVLKISEQEDK